MKKTYLLLAGIIFLVSCKKDLQESQAINEEIATAAGGTQLMNQQHSERQA